jgi:hypothetical protein
MVYNAKFLKPKKRIEVKKFDAIVNNQRILLLLLLNKKGTMDFTLDNDVYSFLKKQEFLINENEGISFLNLALRNYQKLDLFDI